MWADDLWQSNVISSASAWNSARTLEAIMKVFPKGTPVDTVMDELEKMAAGQELTFKEYLDKMMGFLEYINYAQYVVEFRPEDVARSLHGAARKLYMTGVSYRFTALAMFGMTMEYQVIPSQNKLRKH
jgi:hypothetical protein